MRALQEQHAIEEIKAGIAGKQRANEGKEEEEERSQLLRQHFHKSFPFYEITRKVNYDNDQRRYPAPNIPNPGTAWSVSVLFWLSDLILIMQQIWRLFMPRTFLLYFDHFTYYAIWYVANLFHRGVNLSRENTCHLSMLRVIAKNGTNPKTAACILAFVTAFHTMQPAGNSVRKIATMRLRT